MGEIEEHRGGTFGKDWPAKQRYKTNMDINEIEISEKKTLKQNFKPKKCYLYGNISFIRQGWNPIISCFNKYGVQTLFLEVQVGMRGRIKFSAADDKGHTKIIDDSIAEKVSLL